MTRNNEENMHEIAWESKTTLKIKHSMFTKSKHKMFYIGEEPQTWMVFPWKMDTISALINTNTNMVL